MTTTLQDLRATHSVEGDDYLDDEDVLEIAILPGWTATSVGDDMYYEAAESAAEAAQDYVDDGDWAEERPSTIWISVWTWRRAVVTCHDGEEVELRLDREQHEIELEPDEPECSHDDDHDHDWRTPHEVVGGIRENPGCWGHGGGVIMREVCAHCAYYRETDTWAQNPETGEQGLRSIRYEEPDEASIAWVERLKEDEV